MRRANVITDRHLGIAQSRGHIGTLFGVQFDERRGEIEIAARAVLFKMSHISITLTDSNRMAYVPLAHWVTPSNVHLCSIPCAK